MSPHFVKIVDNHNHPVWINASNVNLVTDCSDPTLTEIYCSGDSMPTWTRMVPEDVVRLLENCPTDNPPKIG
jgi:hypothetical protein